MSLMICSSAPAEWEMVCDRCRCRGVEFGRLQQFRHAHDAVHRRADFVAHAREKFALGAAGALRRLFGARGLIDDELQLAICVAQVFRAIGHLLLEELAVFFQARIAMPDLPEHLVEAVDERPDLVLGTALDAQAVVLLGRHALHGLRQVDDGTGDLLLQPRWRAEQGSDDRRRRWPRG